MIISLLKSMVSLLMVNTNILQQIFSNFPLGAIGMTFHNALFKKDNSQIEAQGCASQQSPSHLSKV